MPSPFPPARESELIELSTHIYDKVTATPEAYGLTAEEVIPFATAQEAFALAYAKMADPATKNKVTVELKNVAKKSMVSELRKVVAVAQAWPAMTNAKREELRVPTRGNEPTPIAPPTEMPTLKVQSVSGRLMDLEVLNGENQKRKPAGVRSVWLYTWTGENPSTKLDDWKLRGGSTKSNPQIMFGEDIAPGTVVYVTAAWVNTKDQPGPACAPVKTHIGFQGLNNVAA